ncbi:MAG: 1-acyl-sn-glycerol-3-phosphate acyltransferase, partial [Acidobacteria bacterium]|nr:1-acyl-sn-glycerol-3-phosphate acyltransferase [Acidobacteriota bacterium]
SLLDPSGRGQHRIARVWSRLLLWLSGVKVHLEGLENIGSEGRFVFAANHLSLLDTPLVLACVPVQFRFFAKQTLFRIPLMATYLRRSGHLPVTRGDPRTAVRLLSQGARLVGEQGVSVLLFPEGTRSTSGELQEFKEGAAYVAIQAGLPVAPIGIAGTREVLPIGSLRIRPGHVWVRLGQPIPTQGLEMRDRTALTGRIRAAVLELRIQPGPAPVSEPSG